MACCICAILKFYVWSFIYYNGLNLSRRGSTFIDVHLSEINAPRRHGRQIIDLPFPLFVVLGSIVGKRCCFFLGSVCHFRSQAMRSFSERSDATTFHLVVLARRLVMAGVFALGRIFVVAIVTASTWGRIWKRSTTPPSIGRHWSCLSFWRSELFGQSFWRCFVGLCGGTCFVAFG
jgi:hypothetical protein